MFNWSSRRFLDFRSYSLPRDCGQVAVWGGVIFCVREQYAWSVAEDERGSVFLDEGVQLVVEPDSFPGSRDVDMDGGELRIVDPVVDAGPGFPVSKLDSDGELGVVLAGEDLGAASIPVEVSNKFIAGSWL